MSDVTVLHGDATEQLRTLSDECIQTCVTSPPYWGLRDYGHPGQIGLEPTPEEYVSRLVDVFREVRRALRPDGVAWLNLGDSYNGNGTSVGKIPASDVRERTRSEALTGGVIPPQGSAPRVSGLKPKDLVGIPWRVAFALQADGWYLRSDVIWHKPNPMPESVTDRPTKSHEYIFLLSKSARYAYYGGAIREDGTARTVWTIATQPYSGAHFATFPPDLARRCILAGSRAGDTVLDPFGGSGTTGAVARELGRNAILIELNDTYHALIRSRLRSAQPPLFTEESADV